MTGHVRRKLKCPEFRAWETGKRDCALYIIECNTHATNNTSARLQLISRPLRSYAKRPSNVAWRKRRLKNSLTIAMKLETLLELYDIILFYFTWFEKQSLARASACLWKQAPLHSSVVCCWFFPSSVRDAVVSASGQCPPMDVTQAEQTRKKRC